jgi:hypothetical protein
MQTNKTSILLLRARHQVNYSDIRNLSKNFFCHQADCYNNNTLDLHMGCSWFKFQLQYWLCRVKLFVIFLIQYLHQATTASMSFPIHHSPVIPPLTLYNMRYWHHCHASMSAYCAVLCHTNQLHTVPLQTSHPLLNSAIWPSHSTALSLKTAITSLNTTLGVLVMFGYAIILWHCHLTVHKWVTF